MEDGEIIGLFFERSDSAIGELSRKYGSICMKVSMNILGNRQDSEECVNDAYLALWNKIPPERPCPLAAYLCRIVRNISIGKLKHDSMKKRNSRYDLCLDELEECISGTSGIEDEVSSNELAAHINGFIESLDETNRMLFVGRFWFMESYAELAKTAGMKEGAARTRIARIRKELRKYLIKEGVLYER